MTRIRKLLVAGLMVLVTCCVAVGSAIINFTQSIFSWTKASASANYGSTNSEDELKEGNRLTIGKIETSYKVNSIITLPKATSSDGTQVAPIVTYKGKTVTLDSNNSFKAINLGEYKVLYVSTKSDAGYTVNTVSQEYKIYVTSDTYSFELLKNDPIVLPATLDMQKENVIKIALPILKDKKGDIVTEDIVLGNESDDYFYTIKYTDICNNGEKPIYFGEDGKPVFIEEGVQAPDGKNVYNTYYTYVVTKHDGTESKDAYNFSLLIDINGTDANTVSAGKTLMKLKAFSDKANYFDVAYDYTAVDGANRISYRLCEKNATNFLNPYVDLSVNIDGGDPSFKNDSVKLDTEIDALKNSEVSLKTKVYLKDISAIDVNNGNKPINAYYTYKISYYDKTAKKHFTDASHVVMGIDENGVYFIPNVKGKYVVSYNVVDFYGNKVEMTAANENLYSYELDVTDNIQPEMYFVKSFDSDSTNIDKTDLSYVVPTKYNINTDVSDKENWTKIALPAIYAEDAVANYADITFTRTISSNNFKTTSKSFDLHVTTDIVDSKNDIDSKNVFSFADFETEKFKVEDNKFYQKKDGELVSFESTSALRVAKASQVAYITLDPTVFGAGTYTVRYAVSDGTASSNVKTFTFELVEGGADEVDNEKPEINFDNVDVYDAEEGQTITFAKPEIKDNVDKNLLIKYYVVVDSSPKSFFEITNKIIENKEVKKLEFDMGTASDANSIYYAIKSNHLDSFKIVAFAYDDFAEYVAPQDVYADQNAYAHVGVGEYVVNMKTEDVIAPKFVSRTNTPGVNENEKNYQYKEVTVNGIIFRDDTALANVDVKITDSLGNECLYDVVGGWKVEPVGSDGDYKYEYTFPGVKFVPTAIDNYTVTYYAYDNGGNRLVYAFVLRTTADGEKPVISGISDKTIELGTECRISNINVSDNVTPSQEIKVTATCVGPRNNNVTCTYANGVLRFMPYESGSYEVTVTATDKATNSQTTTFHVNVADTTKPTIVGATSIEKTVFTEEEYNAFISEDNTDVIKLPNFYVIDANQDKTGFQNTIGATGTLKITTPDNDVYVIDDDGNYLGLESSGSYDKTKNPLKLSYNESAAGSYYSFVPNEKGSYEINYSGVDKSGNTVSNPASFTVSVGDTVKPLITATNTLTKLLNNGFVLGENDEFVIDPRVYESVSGDSTKCSSKYFVLTDASGIKTSTDSDTSKNYAKIEVTIRNINGNSTGYKKTTNDDGTISYKFDTAGTYTISVTVRDSVGNLGEFQTTSFKVKAKSTNSSDTSKVLGIVLITVSVAVLAGVVVYFVKGTKSLPKAKKVKAVEEKKEEKKED